MEKKMLREITNDKLTPKKRDSLVETELFDPETDYEADGLEYDTDMIPLAEY